MAGQKKVFVTPLTAVETTDIEGIGTIRYEDNKVYKWVRLQNVTATVAGAANDPVAYRADEYELHWVVLDITDADTIPLCAGLILAAITGTLAVAYYCWIQIKGMSGTIPTAFAGSPAVGDDVGILATDKTLNRRLWAGTTPTIQALVTKMGTVKHVANKEIVLDCPF